MPANSSTLLIQSQGLGDFTKSAVDLSKTEPVLDVRLRKHRSFGEEPPTVEQGSTRSQESANSTSSAGDHSVSSSSSPSAPPGETDRKKNKQSFFSKATSLLNLHMPSPPSSSSSSSLSNSVLKKAGKRKSDQGDKWLNYLSKE
jgi:hypothetical protein